MKNSGYMVKAFALLLSLILFVGVVSLPLHSTAAPAVALTVSDVSGKAGDEVTVSVNISPNSKLGAASILLKYDASKLDYERHADGPAAKGGMAVVNPDYKTDGNFKTIIDAFIHTTGITAGGSLVDITFTIKSDWTGETQLELATTEFIDSVEYKKIVHTTTDGSITVEQELSPFQAFLKLMLTWFKSVFNFFFKWLLV